MVFQGFNPFLSDISSLMAKSDFLDEKEDNATVLICERREHQFSPSLGRGVAKQIPVWGVSGNVTQVSKASERAVCSIPLASLLISLTIVRAYSLHMSLKKTTGSFLHFYNPLSYHLFQHTSQGGHCGALLGIVCRKRDGKTRYGSSYAENGGLEIHRMFWNSITPGIQYLCRIFEKCSDMLSITPI